MISKVLAVAVFALSVGAAQAASLDPLGPYVERGNCQTSDVSGGAVDCYGAVASSEGFIVDANNATFNGTQGLFSRTDWVEKFSSNTVGADFEERVGTFTVNWDLSGPVAVLLRMPGSWVAYLYNGLSAGVYSFNLTGVGTRSLEGIRILATNPVPLPAALPMLAGALGGLVLVGRRRRKAVAA